MLLARTGNIIPAVARYAKMGDFVIVASALVPLDFLERNASK
jgi:hypothetical protein